MIPYKLKNINWWSDTFQGFMSTPEETPTFCHSHIVRNTNIPDFKCLFQALLNVLEPDFVHGV